MPPPPKHPFSVSVPPGPLAVLLDHPALARSPISLTHAEAHALGLELIAAAKALRFRIAVGRVVAARGLAPGVDAPKDEGTI